MPQRGRKWSRLTKRGEATMKWNSCSRWSCHWEIHSLMCPCTSSIFSKHWKKKILFLEWVQFSTMSKCHRGSRLTWHLNLRVTSCFSWHWSMCLSGKFYVWGSGRRWWPSPLNAFRCLVFRPPLALFQEEAWPLDKLNITGAICKADESRNSKRKWET